MPRRNQRRYKPGGRQHRISVRSERCDPMDVRKLGRVALAQALADAEAEKQAQLQAETGTARPATSRTNQAATGEETTDGR